MSFLEHALYYESLGFSVVPVRAGDKAPTMIKWEPYQKQKATPEQIKEWWNKWPSANIGIVTGKISGICVVDFDKYKEDYQQDLADKYFPDSILTPTAKTPSGGDHLYFKYPDNVETLSGNAGKLPAIDLRADGNYIVAPPSVNGNKKPYEWADGLTLKTLEMSFLPQEYLGFVLNNKVFNKGGIIRGENTTHVVSDSTENYKDYKILQEGRRDADLFRIGMALADGKCRRQEIIQILEILARNCNPPFPEKELQDKIKSVFGRISIKERNLTDEVREWVLLQKGIFNTISIRQELQITTKLEIKNLSVIINRLQADGMIEKAGDKRGFYRPVEKDVSEMGFIEEEIYEYPVKLPFGLNDVCALYPQNIVVIAGSKSAGKTAILLNLALANQKTNEVVYLNSEMGEIEWTKRMKNMGCNFKSDIKFKAYSCHSNFHDRIDGTNKIYIVDYLEIHENFFEIAKPIRLIHEKLGKGICFIAVQKKWGEKLGRGAEFSMEKARLYLNLEYEEERMCTKVTIIDAKANKLTSDARGLNKRIKILGGSRIEALDKEWQRK